MRSVTQLRPRCSSNVANEIKPPLTKCTDDEDHRFEAGPRLQPFRSAVAQPGGLRVLSSPVQLGFGHRDSRAGIHAQGAPGPVTVKECRGRPIAALECHTT